jgi:hypothetical protein
MAEAMPTQDDLAVKAEILVEEFLDAFLQHELMNEARDYVERGRNLQMLSSAKLLDTWVTRFECWFKTEGNPRDMDDAAAEIRLRGLEMPYERVARELRALKAGLTWLDPRHYSCQKIHRKINNFIEARNKPMN